MGDETDTMLEMIETDNLNGGCQKLRILHDSNVLCVMIKNEPREVPFFRYKKGC